MRGKPTNYQHRRPLLAGEIRAVTVADNARAKAMHYANIEFLNRLRAEHERAGRRVA